MRLRTTAGRLAFVLPRAKRSTVASPLGRVARGTEGLTMAVQTL